jgi:hypothetical protein
MTDPKGSKEEGKEEARPRRRGAVAADERDERGEKSALLPDLVRRAFAIGLSGIFTTEEAFRRALGDTVPRDWVDFAVEQSDRTRSEFTNRVAEEVARVIEGMDIEAILRRLLEDHGLEVRAEVRLVPREGEPSGEAAAKVRGSAKVTAVGGRRSK